MIATTRRLYQKYRRQHLAAITRGVPLFAPEGSLVGYIDELRYHAGRVHVSGWTIATGLALVLPGRTKGIARSTRRPDVVRARPDLCSAHGDQLGFAGDILWSGEMVSIAFDHMVDGEKIGRIYIPLPQPSATSLRAARRRVTWRFAKAAAGTLLPVVASIIRRQSLDRDALRRRFRLPESLSDDTKILDRTLFLNPQGSAPVSPTEITIILPVYNAFDLLREALRRVEAHTDLDWHLIAVEDCSPDERVRPWLRDWAAERSDRVTLIENTRNLGFIGSVNRAFGLATPDRTVVLLNTDALVPEGWASRLVAPILADKQIASVTPMSNDATIFSIPAIGLSRQLPEGAADHIDETARTLSRALVAEAPTGVGFCMAISSAGLAAVPQFDTVFGKGYGEEVDWCQRTRALGFRHVGIGNLFVEHRGGASFGSEVKTAAIAASSRIIAGRYPDFDREVQEFIADDPLRGARLALALAWAAAATKGCGDSKLSVYVGHSMGGGAETWLARRVAQDLASERPAVILRLGGAARFKIEVHSDAGTITAATDSVVVLKRLLTPLRDERFVYSCGVGDPTGVEIPGILIDLTGPDSDLQVHFHDYWPISPSYALLDSDAVFRGIPDPDTADSAHWARHSDGKPVSLREWRAAWTRLIDAASQLRVYSADSARIVGAVWPDYAHRIVVRPHDLVIPNLTTDSASWANDRPGTIGVLGAIGLYKGAGYLSRIAAALNQRRNAPKLVIIGEFDLSFPLPSGVTVTGRYQVEDLPTLIARHRIQAWLMPSVVPETFSFTTHEMLASGLPVMSFDLGAQGDAVKAAGSQGWILPDDRVETLLTTFEQARALMQGSSSRSAEKGRGR